MKVRGSAERKRGARGNAIAVLLLSIVTVAGGIAALLSVERGRASRAVAQVQQDRAFELAESAVDQAAVMLNGGTLAATGSFDWSNDGEDNDGDGAVDEGDETVSATLTSWNPDGVDNDIDGETDENDEHVVRVAAASTIGSQAKNVTGWLRRTAMNFPEPAAAIYLDDPSANTSFAGNAFSVNGNDFNLDGTPGPNAALQGIAINGDPAQVISQLSGQQLDNVTGAGGTPSVGSFSPGDPAYVENLIDVIEPMASVTFNDYPGTYSGTLGDYATNNFVIAKSNGNFTMGGGAGGAGILLVEGNLTISGAWDWIGYVFVTGQVRFTGGGGAKILRGAMFVGGDVIQGSTSGGLSTFDLILTGTIDVMYSSEALQLIREAFGTYSVNAVTEP